MLTCVISGAFGSNPMRTRWTGPWPTLVVFATADVTFGRFTTTRRGPSLGSLMLVAIRRDVPSRLTAVALPRFCTRISRIAGDGPRRLTAGSTGADTGVTTDVGGATAAAAAGAGGDVGAGGGGGAGEGRAGS